MERVKMHRMVPVVALGLIAAISACAPKQATYAPPVAQAVIPPQPRPPLGAAANLMIPPRSPSGVRHTVNVGITPAQAAWNLRSAYNVAALNCLRPEHASILEGYKQFLKAHSRRLVTINREVDSQFKARHGAKFVRARESYMTQVYNFYALPPTLPKFCDAVQAMSAEMNAVPASGLEAFAAANLPRLDEVFLQFFDSYDQYRADLAAWQQRYAPSAHPLAAIPGAPTAAN